MLNRQQAEPRPLFRRVIKTKRKSRRLNLATLPPLHFPACPLPPFGLWRSWTLWGRTSDRSGASPVAVFEPVFLPLGDLSQGWLLPRLATSLIERPISTKPESGGTLLATSALRVGFGLCRAFPEEEMRRSNQNRAIPLQSVAHNNAINRRSIDCAPRSIHVRTRI